METLESTLSQIHDWSIDRIHELSEEFSESLEELMMRLLSSKNLLNG